MPYGYICLFPFSPTDGVPLDGDDPEHIQWIFQKSVERASQYSIRGVTYRLTQGELVNCHDVGLVGILNGGDGFPVTQGRRELSSAECRLLS